MGGARFGAQHSQAIESWAAAVTGLKVVAPSTPYDVIGLLAASVRDDDPVIFLEQTSLYASKQEVPDGEIVDQLGKTTVVREGSDVTVVSLAAMVPCALEAAETLTTQGADVEVIDLRTLVPLDVTTVLHSVAKNIPTCHRRGEPAALWLGGRSDLD